MEGWVSGYHIVTLFTLKYEKFPVEISAIIAVVELFIFSVGLQCTLKGLGSPLTTIQYILVMLPGQSHAPTYD